MQTENQGVESREPPAIAGRIVVAVRSLLRERGVWDDAHRALAERDPEAGAMLAEPELPEWVRVVPYMELLEAAGRELSETELRALGRERMVRDAQSGYFGGMLRGWIRSVGSEPQDVVRIMPHLWRAGLKGIDNMRVVERDERFARLVVGDVPECVLSCRPWHAVLAGIVEGVLSLVDVSAEVETSTEGDELSFTVRW